MNRICHALGVSALVACSVVANSQSTTTLVAQTANNTSAVDTFTDQSNGNAGAGNVSKINVHTMLYPGAATKMYAHMLLWFDNANHMQIGYTSADANQVRRQINDMIERGIDGVVIDWYGPGNSIDDATKLVMAEVQNHPGFTFSIMVDAGAIKWFPCNGCQNPQQSLTFDLQYLEDTYFSSPNYLRINGNPVVSNFDIDYDYAIDWTILHNYLRTNPTFIFQNAGGFGHALSAGSYSWIIPSPDLGIGYLNDFYGTGLQFPTEQTFGATYKGFNDTLASWSANRVVSQNCGQTWLQTFNTINSNYNAAKPLPAMQLVTWNDYEEGTEIESGIENCVSVTASASSSGSLQWTTQGDEATIDHYTVYKSTDGQTLSALIDLAPGSHALDLCTVAVGRGNVSLFVQAVGKPSMKNHMSPAVSYNAQCSGTASASSIGVSLAASPSTFTVARHSSGSAEIVVRPLAGTFDNPVTLTCVSPARGVTCSVVPSIVTPGGNGASSTLTVAIVSNPMAVGRIPGKQPFRDFWYLGVVGIGIAGGVSRKRLRAGLMLAMAVAAVLLFSACGGGMGASNSPVALTNGDRLNAGSYTVTINGQSGSVQVSTHVTVTVN